MSKKIQPVGNWLIVKNIPKKDGVIETSEGGVDIIQTELIESEVLEVSSVLEKVFPIGTTVIHGANTGYSQFYKKQTCLWLREDDVRGIWTEDKPVKDKGDSL